MPADLLLAAKWKTRIMKDELAQLFIGYDALAAVAFNALTQSEPTANKVLRQGSDMDLLISDVR